ncbi:hypothetical protein MCNS_21920 [Mycobacterium conspicuum]|uniref:Uncharacterized protein n=1 Tax=Mycobacterium conspicuum TaxID=44010 RepID=A0A7I7YBN4_9MYCO|nr:hypothetical protein MCNS_21920 [Mycobacterium conspicuum]
MADSVLRHTDTLREPNRTAKIPAGIRSPVRLAGRRESISAPPLRGDKLAG